MAKKLAQGLGNFGKLDPFDLLGRRRSRTKAAAHANDLSIEAKKKEDFAAQEAADAEAADAEGSAADETKKKQAAANDESRRSALSNFLAAEGGNTTSRRRFLIGAK